MTTGRIEFAPDYESEKRSVNVRVSRETGGAYADPREVIEDELRRLKRHTKDRVFAERARLERAVIDAVVKMRTEGKFVSPEVFATADALIAFEARQAQEQSE